MSWTVLCLAVLFGLGGALPVARANAEDSPDARPLIAAAAAPPADLVNASIRARVRDGEHVLIAGFVIGGGAPKSMLIRAVGPALKLLGVRDVLENPVLELNDIRGHSVLARNRGWSSAANQGDVVLEAQRVGGFPLPAASRDSALLVTLPPGVYTANVGGAEADTGVALLELYDDDLRGQGRLVNLSARTQVGAGEDTLILGLVVAGEGKKRVLIRGVGPALASQGVTDVLPDPVLELRDRSGALVATNDNWSAQPEIAPVAAQLGAFALPAGSKDAALLAALSAGVYTVQVKSADGRYGIALAEMYALPDPPPTSSWTMINVSPNNEQADCHLLRFPGNHNVLIDIADAADAPGSALSYLQQHGITEVDLVVLTHFHQDHYGRLRDLINAGVRVGRVVFNLPAPDAVLTDAEAPWGFSRADANGIIQFLREKGVFCFTPRAGDRLCDLALPNGQRALLDVVCGFDGATTPVGKTDTNDTSLILKLTCGPTRVLFTGDLNGPLGTWLAGGGYDVSADLLKVPHHGTEGCAPNSFFDRVGAKAALVPAPRSLWLSERSARIRDYFQARRIPTYINGVHGHVTVTFGATGYEIGAERPGS